MLFFRMAAEEEKDHELLLLHSFTKKLKLKTGEFGYRYKAVFAKTEPFVKNNKKQKRSVEDIEEHLAEQMQEDDMFVQIDLQVILFE